MRRLATYLYSRPSFVEGVARILDFGNTLSEYNTSPSPEEADELAIWADWQQIGSDFNFVQCKVFTKGDQGNLQAELDTFPLLSGSVEDERIGIIYEKGMDIPVIRFGNISKKIVGPTEHQAEEHVSGDRTFTARTRPQDTDSSGKKRVGH